MNSKTIAMPLINGLKRLYINYLDILTYFTIKTFIPDGDNSSIAINYEHIALRIDTDERSIKRSIANLSLLDLLYEEKATDGFIYTFQDLPVVDMHIPTSFLASSLTSKEKAVLLILKMYCIENEVDIDISIKQISERYGLSCKATLELFESLEKQGYVRLEYDSTTKAWYHQLCGKIDWKCSENDWIYKSFNELRGKYKTLLAA